MLSHALIKESWDWHLKDASCIVYQLACSVTPQSFLGWNIAIVGITYYSGGYIILCEDCKISYSHCFINYTVNLIGTLKTIFYHFSCNIHTDHHLISIFTDRMQMNLTSANNWLIKSFTVTNFKFMHKFCIDSAIVIWQGRIHRHRKQIQTF